jgi:hypothetical protein
MSTTSASASRAELADNKRLSVARNQLQLGDDASDRSVAWAVLRKMAAHGGTEAYNTDVSALSFAQLGIKATTRIRSSLGIVSLMAQFSVINGKPDHAALLVEARQLRAQCLRILRSANGEDDGGGGGGGEAAAAAAAAAGVAGVAAAAAAATAT